MATAQVQSAPFTSLDELMHGICEKVQLSQTEYAVAKTRYEGVGGYLDRHKILAQYHPRVYPQGSVRLGTTVKPKGQQEYDVDLVAELQIDPSTIVNPIKVLNLVQTCLEQNEIYRPLVERKNRCVRLNYVGQFHLDILPACPDPSSGGTCLVVPDCEAKSWKASNPEGYAKWFEAQCHSLEESLLAKAAPLPKPEAVEEKAPLKLAVQLFKRARDVKFNNKPETAPRSIILTTLCASYYSGELSVSETMTNIIDSILGSVPLWGRPRLVVLNPMNLKEDFSESWNDPIIYTAFINFMQELSASWELLRAARGISNVKAILEKLFGEDITAAVVEEHVRRFNQLREQRAVGVTAAGILMPRSPQSVPVPRHTYHGK